MGSHSEQPMTAPPTRRSLREAERRAASEPTPVTAPRPDPDAPTAAHHVPAWAHHEPAPTPVTEAFAVPAGRVQHPAGPQARSAWTSSPQTRSASPISSAPPARTAPSTPSLQQRTAAAFTQTIPAPPVRSAPAPAVVAAPPTPVATVTWPAPPRAWAGSTPVAADPEPEPAPSAAPAPVVARSAAPEPVVAPRVEDVPELAGVPHGTVGRRTRRPTRTAARLSVLGVLAGITVVIPVSQGVVTGPAAFGSDALADSTLPSTVSALAGSSLSALPPSSLVSADGALQARGLAAASRTEERSALPGCDGSLRAAGQNGLLKVADLCTLWDNHTQLRADAAVSLAEFNQAFAARFGGDLCLSSGYRTLAAQRAVKAQKGGLAAAPGKSNHGWGLAVDLCQDQTSGVKWRWITENGPTYGWDNPDWAQPGGSGPFEKWHWEFTKGVQQDGEYYDG